MVKETASWLSTSRETAWLISTFRVFTMVAAVVYFAARLEGQVREMGVEVRVLHAEITELHDTLVEHQRLMMDTAKEVVGLRLSDHALNAEVRALRVRLLTQDRELRLELRNRRLDGHRGTRR